ncbi:hypothetical protein IPJ72_00310 [Candidatus Peregrinibacteria bacterium]|nr:MAG: hypothetical protein IPJ72_00310 [Candidatus Peregrinibacteria bacterium]
MEYALLKFKKAVEIANGLFDDAQLNQNYNPALKRYLISLIYKNGVSRYEGLQDGVHRFESNQAYYGAVLVDLLKTKEFNQNQPNQQLDRNTTNFVSLYVRLTKKAAELQKEMQLLGKDAVKNKAAIDTLKPSLEAAQKEVESAKKYWANPTDSANKTWFENAVKANKAEFDEERSVDINYKVFELHNRGTERKMEYLLGIQLEGVYEAYVKAVQENPRLKTVNWGELIQSDTKGDRELLVNHLRAILPDDKRGGKEAFLFIIENMEGSLTEKMGGEVTHNDPELGALSILGLIKNHIESEEEKETHTTAKTQEFERRMNGAGITDYIQEYGENIWDMLMNGDLKSRAAAIFAIFMAFKAGKKAFGDNPGITGNLLKIGLAGLAADVIAKETTGKGIFERLKVHNLENAFEGTDEAALVNYTKPMVEGGDIPLNPEQQHATLQEMRNVPFHDLMEWYFYVEQNPGENLKPANGVKDPFKNIHPAINTGRIADFNKTITQDKDLVGRTAVYKTMKGFFDYVGNKEGRDQNYGRRALEARWVHPFTGEAETTQGRYTSWTPPEKWLASFKENPKTLTWEVVLKAEMRMEDINRTVGDNWMDQSVNAVKGAADVLSHVGRRVIKSPTQEALNKAYETTRYEWIPGAKNVINSWVQKGADSVEFGKEAVTIWYGAHKIEIKRRMDQHLDLAKDATTGAIELIIGVDTAAVEWADTKLNQLRQVVTQKFGNGDVPIPLINEEINGHFFENDYFKEFLGKRYADQFKEAFNNGGFHLDERGANAEILKNIQDAINEGTLPASEATKEFLRQYQETPANIAYTNIEVTANEIPAIIKNPSLRMMWMQTKAEERARETMKRELAAKYPDMDMSAYTDDYFDRFLIPITSVSKTSSADGTEPEKLTVFYRMPMHTSPEVWQMEQGTWTDYEDPRQLKNREPLVVDPTRSTVTNIIEAFAPEYKAVLGPTKKGALIALAKAYELVHGSLEGITSGIKFEFEIKGEKKTIDLRMLDQEEFKKAFDETSGGAKEKWSSISAYYRGGEYTERVKKADGSKGYNTKTITEAEAQTNREKYIQENPDK